MLKTMKYKLEKSNKGSEGSIVKAGLYFLAFISLAIDTEDPHLVLVKWLKTERFNLTMSILKSFMWPIIFDIEMTSVFRV